MPLEWRRIYNRLLKILNSGGDAYFSGPKFINVVKRIDDRLSNYGDYIEERRREGKSTSRKDFFYDILMDNDEATRVRIVNEIIKELEDNDVEHGLAELKGMMSDAAIAPNANIAQETWNSERLNNYLTEIDTCITASNYDRAVSLSYTCLEGFYKAFIREKIPDNQNVTEIIAMSRLIRTFLREQLTVYPDEAVNLVNSITHTVDRARNRFSEAHFDNESARWLAIFIRDLVNTQIRLLLHFL